MADKAKKNSIKADKRQSLAPTKMEKPTATRYEPTYRMEAKRPFHRETCEKIIQRVVKHAVSSFIYTSKAAQTLAKHMSEEIKSRIKMLDYDRYKLVCVVTVGERYYQSYNSVSTILWDPEKDGILTYVHDAPNFFVVVSLYYLYFD